VGSLASLRDANDRCTTYPHGLSPRPVWPPLYFVLPPYLSGCLGQVIGLAHGRQLLGLLPEVVRKAAFFLKLLLQIVGLPVSICRLLFQGFAQCSLRLFPGAILGVLTRGSSGIFQVDSV
jgi:hypothetical protein